MERAVKVPYEESPKKRFEVSHDEHSRERLQAVRELKNELEENFLGIPFAVSLFGSLTKGKELSSDVAKVTDIDIAIFYDTEIFYDCLPELLVREDFCLPFFKSLVEKYNNFISYQKFNTFVDNGEFRKTQEKIYGYEANLKKLKSIASKDTFETEEIDLIKEMLDSLKIELEDILYKPVAAFTKKSRLFTEVVSDPLPLIMVQGLREHGRFSVLDQVTDWLELELKADQMGNRGHISSHAQMMRFNMVPIFALDVGGGLKKYRQAFIEDLLSLPGEEGERVWAAVSEAIRKLERRQEIPGKIGSQFPKTLAEAAKYYVVKDE